jgi:putative ABC transport system permease protein
MKYLELILRNMTRRIRRTLLTIVMIGIATLVFAMLMAVPASMDHIIAMAGRGQRLFVTNRSGPYGVPAQDCEDIKKIPQVEGCAANWDFYELYRSDSDWIGIVASDKEILAMSPDFDSQPAVVTNFLRDRRAVAVGTVLLRKYNWHTGQKIMLHFPSGAGMDFLIAGEIPSARYPNLFLMRSDYLKEFARAHGGSVGPQATRLVVQVDTADNVGPVARAIDQKFHNSDYETRTQTESDAIAQGLANIGNIRAIIFSLVAVVIITVVLIAGNSMAMTVRDRIPEVALLRTLGFDSARIALLLFGEAIALGLVGGMIGAAGALAIFAGGMNLGTITSGLGLIAITPAVIIESMVVAIAVSLLSGTFPIAGALRVAPAIALRKVV